MKLPKGLLELMDGNHRHEFANRVGGVTHSKWLDYEAGIKKLPTIADGERLRSPYRRKA